MRSEDLVSGICNDGFVRIYYRNRFNTNVGTYILYFITGVQRIYGVYTPFLFISRNLHILSSTPHPVYLSTYVGEYRCNFQKKKQKKKTTTTTL